MKLQRLFFASMCLFCIIISAKQLLSLVDIFYGSSILNSNFSISYKLGFILGKIIKIVGYFALAKFLFDKYLPELKLFN